MLSIYALDIKEKQMKGRERREKRYKGGRNDYQLFIALVLYPSPNPNPTLILPYPFYPPTCLDLPHDVIPSLLRTSICSLRCHCCLTCARKRKLLIRVIAKRKRIEKKKARAMNHFHHVSDFHMLLYCCYCMCVVQNRTFIPVNA